MGLGGMAECVRFRAGVVAGSSRGGEEQPGNSIIRVHLRPALQRNLSAGTFRVGAGVATTAGVEATAREAYDRGFNVVIVEDAMSDMSADNHTHAMTTTYPRIAEVTTTAEALRALLSA